MKIDQKLRTFQIVNDLSDTDMIEFAQRVIVALFDVDGTFDPDKEFNSQTGESILEAWEDIAP